MTTYNGKWDVFCFAIFCASDGINKKLVLSKINELIKKRPWSSINDARYMMFVLAVGCFLWLS